MDESSAERSRPSTTLHRTASPVGQSSETIPSRHSPRVGAAWGIRHRTRRSRQRLESRMGLMSSGDAGPVAGDGSISHRVDAEERSRTSFGGRTTITSSADSPRRRRSSSPSWTRRLSRASKALPSTITASSAGVRIAASRHHRLAARSSSSGRTKTDRSSNRASTPHDVFRNAFDMPPWPWPVIWLSAITAVVAVRRDTRFHGPGRHRLPIQAMLGADRPSASCAFRIR